MMSVVSMVPKKLVLPSGLSFLNFQKFNPKTIMKENAYECQKQIPISIPPETARTSGGIFFTLFKWIFVFTDNNCFVTGSWAYSTLFLCKTAHLFGKCSGVL